MIILLISTCWYKRNFRIYGVAKEFIMLQNKVFNMQRCVIGDAAANK